MGVGSAVVAAWLTALSVYDIRYRRLPNWLTLPGAVVIVVAAVSAGHGIAALAGSAALTALYLVVHLVSPRSLGAGDVKLALGVGALTGAYGIDVWALAALGAPLLTAVWGGVALLRGAGPTVPHGPAMCLAAALAVTPAMWA